MDKAPREKRQETRRHIVTGGPGSGKSTLVEALRRMGFNCFPEVSRDLIRREVTRPNGVTPWKNLPAFARLAFGEMMRQHDVAGETGGVSIFDRGIPDIFGYLQEGGYGIPEEFIRAHKQCRYDRTVFILPPWPEIYVNDTERPQSYAEAESLYYAIRQAYVTFGYSLVEVPEMPVEERCAFLSANIGIDAVQAGDARSGRAGIGILSCPPDCRR